MNPYLIIALILAWLSSLAGVGYWQNDAGHVAERTTWQTRENDELRRANAAIKTLQEAARKKEQDHATELATVSTDYERKLTYASKQRADDLAAIRAGTLRLRDPGTAGLRADQCSVSSAGSGAGGRDGGQGAELSRESTEFLFNLASDADAIVEQLTACQQVVRADRSL